MVREAMDSIVEDLEATGLKESQWTEQQVCSTPSYQKLSEWMKPALLSAIELEFVASLDRFKSISKFDSHDAFEWMEGFVATVRDDKVQSKLASALQQRKPFRRFRDAMGSDRRLQQQWRTFESARQREEMIQWLRSIDIEPLNPNELAYDAPPLPQLRKIMFAEVRRFVRLARDVPGIQQIALIGSPTTDKEFPKDIDLLVTITEDCDLSKLARLGRQLAGHMMAHGAGADVFLADPANQYLGRTCSWKRCEPAIRSSCDAQSCGARQYLHDDFSAIRLSKKVIQNPPVLLWPKVAATSPSTPDIQTLLLDPLSQGTD
jgi:predicted nucleotidyltransferase